MYTPTTNLKLFNVGDPRKLFCTVKKNGAKTKKRSYLRYTLEFIPNF